MRAVYAHFPINITSTQDNTVVDIRNFLGEKFTRTVHLKPGVTCTPTGNKDEIQVEGNDLEMVTLSGECVLVMEWRSTAVWSFNYSMVCLFSCSHPSSCPG